MYDDSENTCEDAGDYCTGCRATIAGHKRIHCVAIISYLMSLNGDINGGHTDASLDLDL
jgi:hypothetical protein